jgi:hypothetical protein
MWHTVTSLLDSLWTVEQQRARDDGAGPSGVSSEVCDDPNSPAHYD